MTTRNSGDVNLNRLAGLAVMPPDEVHAAAVRARCLAVLARQRRRPDARSSNEPAWRLEFAGLGAVGLLYTLVVVRQALAF